MPKKLKSAKRKRRPEGACYHPGCRRKSVGKLECLTCEKLAAQAKIRLEEITTIHACDQHWPDGVAKLKRHALAAHPLNILRATGAALAGEDVF